MRDSIPSPVIRLELATLDLFELPKSDDKMSHDCDDNTTTEMQSTNQTRAFNDHQEGAREYFPTK